MQYNKAMNKNAATRIVFLGTPDFAVPSLASLHKAGPVHGWQVVGVGTQPDKPAGRGNQVAMSPVKQYAQEQRLPVLQPASLRKDPAAVESLAALAPDLLVVAAYGLILPSAVLSLPTFGSINVHASLLPVYRGASPITASILDGREETGVTIMLMDEGMDTGPSLRQQSESIQADDTTQSLSRRLALLGASLLVETLPHWLAGELGATPQSALPGEPSVCRLIRKEAGRMDWTQPAVTIERAMRCLPSVDFVNGYGLTETSSTIAVLTPEDHRQAFASDDPDVRRRLGSVGRPLPSIELEIRDAGGQPVPAGQDGEVWVRGEQVSGEYLDRKAVHADGWFPTKDYGWLDEGGFLFLGGRLDDVIVRGGENISPGEIEDLMRSHPAIKDVAVIGLPDEEWGEKIVAVVVADPPPEVEALRAWVRERLRSTKTPEQVFYRAALPYTETGKLRRRALQQEVFIKECIGPRPLAHRPTCIDRLDSLCKSTFLLTLRPSTGDKTIRTL